MGSRRDVLLPESRLDQDVAGGFPQHTLRDPARARSGEQLPARVAPSEATLYPSFGRVEREQGQDLPQEFSWWHHRHPPHLGRMSKARREPWQFSPDSIDLSRPAASRPANVVMYRLARHPFNTGIDRTGDIDTQHFFCQRFTRRVKIIPRVEDRPASSVSVRRPSDECAPRAGSLCKEHQRTLRRARNGSLRRHRYPGSLHQGSCWSRHL